MGIYKITSPTNKVYIGQGTDIYNRWKYYKSYGCVGQTRLYKSLKKYLVENHIFEIIEECEESELNNRERYWQDYYDVTGKNGLNGRLQSSNDKSGKITEIHRQKLVESHKNRIYKPLSEEHKNKIKKANTGRKWSEENLKNMLEGRYKTLRKVKNTETGIIYRCASEAARAYNVSTTLLSLQLKGKRKNTTNSVYYNE